MLDKDKIKESLTVEDITKILDELGSELNHSEPNRDSKGNPIYQTVCHNSYKGSKKLYYYNESKMFHCYTNCGNMDIYEVVINAKKQQGYDFSFYDSVKYVAEITGRTYHAENDIKSSNKIDDWEWINRISYKKPTLDKELDTYNEHVLEIFLPYQNNWIDEGITKEIAELYEIGYSLQNNSITIPHRNKQGGLVGIRQRNLSQEEVNEGRKYIPIYINGRLYNHQTSHNLYGLHITKDNITKYKRVYLFEGEKSVMKSHLYYPNDNFSVAVSGSNISQWQVDKILELGVHHVVIAFDKFRKKRENESEKIYSKHVLNYQKKLLRLAHKFSPYCRTYIIWDFDDKLNYNDSPIDKSKKVFEELTENKIEITTKGSELLEI